MKVVEDVSIKVVVDLKELADLEDRSIKTVDGENIKIFTIANVKIIEKTRFDSSEEKGIMATATIVLNDRSTQVINEVNTVLKKLLKIKI